MAVHPGLHRIPAVFLKGIGRHGDNRNIRQPWIFQRPNRSGGLVAVHRRHLHIHQDDVVEVRRRPLDLLHSHIPIIRLLHHHSVAFQQLPGDFTVEGVVLHQQHALALQIRGILRVRCVRWQIRHRSNAEAVDAAEFRAFALFAPAGNLAAQLLHNAPRDGQPKSRAFNTADEAAVFPFKRVKHAAQEFRTHANAVINHAALVETVFTVPTRLPDTVEDGSAFRGVFHGVTNQVQRHLIDLQRIKEGNFVLHVAFRGEMQVLFAHVRLKNAFFLRHRGRNVMCRNFQLQLAALDARQIQHIVNQAKQMLAGQVDFRQTVLQLLRIIKIFFRHRRKAHDGVHRRADVVAHVEQEGTLRATGALSSLLGAAHFLRLLNIPVNAANHGNAVQVAVAILHQDVSCFHPVDFAIIATLAHMQRHLVFASFKGGHLRITSHGSQQLLIFLRIDKGVPNVLQHFLYRHLVQLWPPHNAPVIKDVRMIFRQVDFHNVGINRTGGCHHQIHARLVLQALLRQRCHVADANQNMLFALLFGAQCKFCL